MTAKNRFEAFWKKWEKMKFNRLSHEKDSFSTSQVHQIIRELKIEFTALCEKEIKSLEKNWEQEECGASKCEIFRLVAPRVKK